MADHAITPHLVSVSTQVVDALACAENTSDRGAMTYTDEDQPAFGMQLRSRREDVRLSQAQLATLAGVHRGTVRNAEQGRPLEVRTIANILRTLGCAPVIAYETRDGPGGIRPVMTITSTAAIVGILLQLDMDEQQRSAVDSYYELVDQIAAARSPYREGTASLPARFDAFRETIVSRMTTDQVRMFDIELSDAFGDAYPYELPPAPGERLDRLVQLTPESTTHRQTTDRPAIRGTADATLPGLTASAAGQVRRRPDPELDRVLASDLPRPIQATLIDWITSRRAAFAVELEQMIDTLHDALEQRRKEGEGGGSEGA